MPVAEKERYPVLRWRFALEILGCWAVIAGAVAGSRAFGAWFYPLAWLVVGNRQLALLLLSHEAVHGTLVRGRFWNEFFGRYFCALPVFISLKKYRRLHHFHHRAVGVAGKDPDLQLYEGFPMRPRRFALRLLGGVVSLRVAYSFFIYLTEIPEAMSGRRALDGRRFIFSRESDFVSFAVFTAALFSLLAVTGMWRDYLLFFFLPMLVVMHPHALLGGALQHGPLRDHVGEAKSRTITGPAWLIRPLFPFHINYHGEHHLNPYVPHYWLPYYARELAGRKDIWRQDLRDSLRGIFRSGD